MKTGELLAAANSKVNEKMLERLRAEGIRNFKTIYTNDIIVVLTCRTRSISMRVPMF